MTHEDFLLHYGVKGMKWGVRKQRQGYGTKKAGVKTAFSGIKRQAKLTRDMYNARGIEKMSARQMEQRIRRLKLENAISSLRYDFGANRTTRRAAKQLFRNRDSFSDAELRKKIRRLQKEREYSKQLRRATKPTRTFAKTVLETAVESMKKGA